MWWVNQCSNQRQWKLITARRLAAKTWQLCAVSTAPSAHTPCPAAEPALSSEPTGLRSRALCWNCFLVISQQPDLNLHGNMMHLPLLILLLVYFNICSNFPPISPALVALDTTAMSNNGNEIQTYLFYIKSRTILAQHRFREKCLIYSFCKNAHYIFLLTHNKAEN